MDELKPCPFCGEDAEHIHVYQYEEIVRCTNECCFVRPSVTCQLPEECVEVWNRRAALAATQAGWISVKDRLPEERDHPYQVIVCAVKQYDPKSMYAGLNQRRFLQDWVVRRWPQNFTHWMEAMPWPDAPESSVASKEE